MFRGAFKALFRLLGTLGVPQWALFGFETSWAALGAFLGVSGRLFPGAGNAPGRGFKASWDDSEASRGHLGMY